MYLNDQINNTNAVLKPTTEHNGKILLTKRLTDNPIKLRNYTISCLDRRNDSKYCCNRPSTWETTEDIRKILIISSKKRENGNSVEDSEVENENIVLADTTTLKHPTYHFNVSLTTATTRRVITEISPSLTTKMLLTFVPKKKNSKTKMPCKYKCQRPVTWITSARKNKWTTI